MRPIFIIASCLALAAGPALAQSQMGTTNSGQPTTGSSGSAPGSSPAQSGGSLNMGAGSQTQGAQSQGSPTQASKDLQQRVQGATGGIKTAPQGADPGRNMPAASQGGAGGSTSLHGDVNAETQKPPK